MPMSPTLWLVVAGHVTTSGASSIISQSSTSQLR
jgi:hypothetical protein